MPNTKKRKCDCEGNNSAESKDAAQLYTELEVKNRKTIDAVSLELKGVDGEREEEYSNLVSAFESYQSTILTLRKMKAGQELGLVLLRKGLQELLESSGAQQDVLLKEHDEGNPHFGAEVECMSSPSLGWYPQLNRLGDEKETVNHVSKRLRKEFTQPIVIKIPQNELENNTQEDYGGKSNFSLWMYDPKYQRHDKLSTRAIQKAKYDVRLDVGLSIALMEVIQDLGEQAAFTRVHKYMPELLKKLGKTHYKEIELNQWKKILANVEVPYDALPQLAVVCELRRFIFLLECMRIFRNVTVHKYLMWLEVLIRAVKNAIEFVEYLEHHQIATKIRRYRTELEVILKSHETYVHDEEEYYLSKVSRLEEERDMLTSSNASDTKAVASIEDDLQYYREKKSQKVWLKLPLAHGSQKKLRALVQMGMMERAIALNRT
ncbi:hypothetical protein B0O99DRAFT_597809 [Bisporella sp. PMI_857]|nr:hypothetical protein B0O99DRAFT_597809 [Bisporella sp. PMI_857]